LAVVCLMACGGGELTLSEEGAVSEDAQLVAAPACSAAKLAEIVAPATTGNGSVQINCTAKLSGQRITKKVYFSGPAASGASLDCGKGSIGNVDEGTGLVNVRSVKNAAGVYERPVNVTVSNCTIEGAVVITGMNAADELIESEKPGFIAVKQKVSPAHAGPPAHQQPQRLAALHRSGHVRDAVELRAQARGRSVELDGHLGQRHLLEPRDGLSPHLQQLHPRVAG
jgi:hypothetical protein